MTTDTATLEAIRDRMISVLEGLAVTRLASVPFRAELGSVSFMEWAEANPNACLRRFSLLRVGFEAPPAVSNLDIEEVRSQLLLVVAYPRQWGLYGKEEIRDADDLIAIDTALIDGRSGIGKANVGGYVAGQHASLLLESPTEDGERVRFARHLFEVTYYRGVAP